MFPQVRPGTSSGGVRPERSLTQGLNERQGRGFWSLYRGRFLLPCGCSRALGSPASIFAGDCYRRGPVPRRGWRRSFLAFRSLYWPLQLLGIAGLFRLVPLLALLIAIALSQHAGCARRTSSTRVRTQTTKDASLTAPGRQEATWEPVAAIVAAGLVVAEWSGGSFNALRFGVSGVDSYWYHMPLAAVFAQSGSVVAPHNINNDNVIEFYPATSELLHAVGIVLLGSDFLSPLVNLLWLALALFAAWCIGKRFGVASIAIVATSMVLGTIEIIASQPGSAYDDVAGVALFLSALALLANVDGLWLPGVRAQGVWVAALAAGLTIGIKDTFIVSVAALTCCVIALLPRGQRGRGGCCGAWSHLRRAGSGMSEMRTTRATLFRTSISDSGRSSSRHRRAKSGAPFGSSSSMDMHGGTTSFQACDRISARMVGAGGLWPAWASSLGHSSLSDGFSLPAPSQDARAVRRELLAP